MNTAKRQVSSAGFEYRTTRKGIWITEVVFEDGSKGYGLGDTKSEAEYKAQRSSKAQLGLPPFMYEMGSYNPKNANHFLTTINCSSLIFDNIPVNMVPDLAFTVLYDKPSQGIAIVCDNPNDKTKELLYAYEFNGDIAKAIHNCLELLVIEIFKDSILGQFHLKQSKKNAKLNEWYLTWLSKLPCESFNTAMSK